MYFTASAATWLCLAMGSRMVVVVGLGVVVGGSADTVPTPTSGLAGGTLMPYDCREWNAGGNIIGNCQILFIFIN